MTALTARHVPDARRPIEVTVEETGQTFHLTEAEGAELSLSLALAVHNLRETAPAPDAWATTSRLVRAKARRTFGGALD